MTTPPKPTALIGQRVTLRGDLTARGYGAHWESESRLLRVEWQDFGKISSERFIKGLVGGHGPSTLELPAMLLPVPQSNELDSFLRVLRADVGEERFIELLEKWYLGR